MTLARNDEHTLLADNLRRYLSEANEFEQRRHRLASAKPERMALWAGLAEMGMLGLPFDEESGGFGGDARSVAILLSELGRSLAVEPVLGTTLIAGRLLRAANDVERIRRIISGELVVVLAHDAGHDAFGTPAVRADATSGGYSLTGRLGSVRHADVAHELLIVAQCNDRIDLFCVPLARLTHATHRLVDGAGGAEIRLDKLLVESATRLRIDGSAEDSLADARDWGVFGLVAETLGLIEAANEATFRYLSERKQFGVTLGSFQALQHRCADMRIAQEEVSALLDLAIKATANPASAQRSAVLSAAKATADQAGRKIGHDAVQLHGGMGVSDELNVSHIARRLAAIRGELGSADLHRLRFGTQRNLGELLELQDSEDARAWRHEVAAFTRAKLPESIAHKTRHGLKIGKDDYVGWQNVLAENGLFGCAWPEAHGGRNWNLVKQLIFTQESTACGAPMLSPYGVKMVGPVIYTFGNEAQQQRHLPGILSNEVWWCQGYSEPGAGSDLASLKTFARREGDEYVVNGAKLWTTEAHWADWMHCLVRTDREGKPQNGISFLLIDMKTSGISVKPILTIDGLHHTNAVFFDEVRVPVENLVGRQGQGWGIAKFLLGNERVSIADTGPKLRLLAEIQRHFESQASTASDSHRALLTAKLADVSIQLLTLCALERRCVEAWDGGKPFGSEASILKIRGTEVLQAIAELGVELGGPAGIAYDPEHLQGTSLDVGVEVQRAASMMYEYLYSRCWSIFGGTNEIQRNLLARDLVH